MSAIARLEAIERWLTPRRLKAAAQVVLAGNLVATVSWWLTRHGLMDRFHQPMGGDFIIFYAASKLTLQGHALMAFSAGALGTAERLAVAGAPPGLLWCYPPPFQMIIAPLAAAPFLLAFALWSGLGLAGYLAVLRRINRLPWTMLFALAFPGLFVTLWQGQTSLFVFTVLGGGLIMLDRRPIIAGAILGLLICKPQFALMLPVVMLCTGRWASILGAALSASLLTALSTLLLGLPLLTAFVINLPEVSQSLARGLLPWAKMPSLYVALAWLGAPKAVALALQGIAALGVLVLTVAEWRRPGPLGVKAGLLVLATLIATPYSFNYDLVLIAIPIAAVARYGARATLPVGTKLLMGLAALTPNLFLSLAQKTHVQLTPLAIAVVFWAVWRVSRVASAQSDQQSADPRQTFGINPIPSAFPPPRAQWRPQPWPAARALAERRQARRPLNPTVLEPVSGDGAHGR